MKQSLTVVKGKIVTDFLVSSTLVIFMMSVCAYASPPSKATNPNPENAATNVDINANLSWTAGSASSYDGEIIGWGDNASGQCTVPEPNTNFMAVATGGSHSLGLKTDGSIVAWGNNASGQCSVPNPNTDFTAIAAGGSHSLGLKTDGSIVAWGNNTYGQCTVPSPNTGFTAIVAGEFHSLGLKTDGSIVAWGRDWYGECEVPSPNTNFIAIAASLEYSLGLKADGSIVAWGYGEDGQCTIPSPNTGFTAITAGWYHALGMKTDGSIVAWGINSSGQCTVPPPNTGFTAIAAGATHSLGLKADGSIVTWGYNGSGQCTVPEPNTGFIAIAASKFHSLGLKSDSTGTVTHDVYFGTDSTPDETESIGNQSETSYSPGTLNYNTTYYWRIDEKDACDTTTGDVWSFTTNTAVPNVIDMSQADANTAIAAAYLVVGTITTQCSDTITAGNVISQDPNAGTSVSSGSAVDLVVSTGQPSVPDVTGMPVDQAIVVLTAAGVSIGVSSSECSNTIPLNYVISQSAVGTVPCGTFTVDLVVSTGQPSVPNVVGMTEAAAIAQINAVSDISYGSSTTACSDTIPAGDVISQSAVGTVSCGTVVELVVSSGQPSIPIVVGDYEASALVVLNTIANISYGSSTYKCSDTVGAGIVISQSATGTVSCGTVVDLVVSTGPCPRTIWGYVTESDANMPLENVSVNANNGGGSDVTDVNGYYEITVDYGWSGTAVPSKTGYMFEPNSITYINVTIDTEQQNYIGSLLAYKIKGYIKNACLVPIEDVNVTASLGASSDITDANGYYEIWVDYNWSGTVTPSKPYYTFDPNSRAYANVAEDMTAQDYVADNVYDLDCDGIIGWGDVGVISENWLSGHVDVNDGDFNEDDTVNFMDFAEFGLAW